jgi:hypothetical protein
MKRKIISIGLVIIVASLALMGCSNGKSNGQQILGQDARLINNELRYLQRKEKLPLLLDSGDLRNQNYYYTAIADPNKVWYLVTESMSGQVTGGPYLIRGPVQNTADSVTAPTQQICAGGSNGEKNCDTVELAEPNGLYASPSVPDHFAILASGGILRWEGWYKTSDVPINVKVPVNININESTAPTSTDLSKSKGGTLPPKANR